MRSVLSAFGLQLPSSGARLRHALCAGVALASAAFGPARAAENTSPPVAVPQSEEVAVHSKAGQDYRIQIYRPAAPPPPGGYPVIYVLDGNAWFGPMASAVNLQTRGGKMGGMDPAVVVALAYPGDQPFNQLRRFYDFIPPIPLVEKVPPGYEPPKIGGADELLAFFADELEPMIEKRVQIDRGRRTLFGHSLGCSFALHALFTRTAAFSSYVCGSPTLGFNGGYVLAEGERFIERLKTSKVDTSLFFAVAEYDETMPPNVDPAIAARMSEMLKGARVVTGGRELHAKLAPLEASGLHTTFVEIKGENHISMVPVLINRMLPVVLRSAPAK